MSSYKTDEQMIELTKPNNKTMETKFSLKQISDYYKTKLFNGEFEFVSCTENVAVVEIDGSRFTVWIANKEMNYGFYFYGLDRDMELLMSFIDSEGYNLEKGYKYIEPLVIGYRKNVLIKQKQEELDRLISETNI